MQCPFSGIAAVPHGLLVHTSRTSSPVFFRLPASHISAAGTPRHKPLNRFVPLGSGAQCKPQPSHARVNPSGSSFLLPVDHIPCGAMVAAKYGSALDLPTGGFVYCAPHQSRGGVLSHMPDYPTSPSSSYSAARQPDPSLFPNFTCMTTTTLPVGLGMCLSLGKNQFQATSPLPSTCINPSCERITV